MKHLLSHSVYQDLSLFGKDPRRTMESMGCDGLELLTGYSDPDSLYAEYTVTAHLPFAPDWLSAWENRPLDFTDEEALYFSYGKCREDTVSNVRRAIECASKLNPAHGVFHACNLDTPELFRRDFSRPDSRVLDALCGLMNETVSAFPGGEPPFRIVFENLWYPGLRMLDATGFGILEKKLEFGNWGLCLDTGHMMNCLPVSSEREGIEMLADIFGKYPEDMRDRISAVHFHWSASWEYRRSFGEKTFAGPSGDFLGEAYAHVSKIDMHMPFSDPGCAALAEILDPDFLIHEMPGSEKGVLEDFAKQRSLLPR